MPHRFRFDRIAAISLLGIALIVMLFALTAPGRAQQGTEVTISRVNDSSFPTLQLLVTVTDEQQVPIRGLTQADFAARLNTTSTAVVAVEEIVSNDQPVSVVLVLDSSESMLGKPLEDTKAAANILLDNLRPGDEVALIDFDSASRIITPFTTDLNRVREGIAQLDASGRTALYDAAYAGAELALGATYPRRFVVLLTDGNEFGRLSQQGPDAGIALARDNNIQVFTVGLGFDLNERYLNRLGSETRGQTYLLPSSDRLAGIFDFVANYLRSQYVVTLRPDIQPDGGTYDLTLEARGGSATVTYTAPDLFPVPTLRDLPTQPITAPTTIKVGVTAPREIDSVTVTVDGTPVDLRNRQTSANNQTISGDLVIDPYTLTPGKHLIAVEATDKQGGKRAASGEIEVAELPILFTVDDLSDGAFLRGKAQPFSVTVGKTQAQVESVTVTVDGAQVAVSQTAPYTFSLDNLALGPGAHTVVISVRNAVGIVTEQTLSVTVDPELFITPTNTPSRTPTRTHTPTPTASNTPTSTFTNTATNTATATFTPTFTDTPTATATSTATATDTATSTPTDTATATLTNTATPARDLAFTVVGLASGETVADPAREITVTQTDATQPLINNLVVTVDGEQVTTLTAAPFTFTLDMLALGAGAHVMEVTASNGVDKTTTQVSAFEVSAALFVTPSATPSATATATATLTNTSVPPTEVPTDTPTEIPSSTPTDTPTPLPTLSSALLAVTEAAIASETAEARPTSVPTDTVTATQTATETTAPSATSSATSTPTSTETASVTPSATVSETPVPVPPTFRVSGVVEGDSVLTNEPNREVVVIPDGSDQPAFTEVTFTLDGQVVATDTTAPFSHALTPGSLTPGEHVLVVTVTNGTGGTATQTIRFNVLVPTATPLPTATPTPDNSIGAAFARGGVAGVVTALGLPNWLLVICCSSLLFLLVLAVVVTRRRNRSGQQ
jgi:VWFA-related protein